MKCFNCKQYKSDSLWNHCNITGAECFPMVEDCDLVDENGNDNGRFDQICNEIEAEIRAREEELNRLDEGSFILEDVY